jgi:hypothetical protein
MILGVIHAEDGPDDIAKLLDTGLDVDWADPETGLPLLHYAVGMDRPETVRFFLNRNARVGPDREGREAYPVDSGSAICSV